MVLSSHGSSCLKRFATGTAATAAFVLAFAPASVANVPTANSGPSAAIAADAATSKPIVVAEQNVLVVPGQEAMQPQQAEIIQRNEQQEQVDAAKHQPDAVVVPAYPAYADPVVERNTRVEVNEGESRQEELERPQRRQTEIERGDRRQKDLEMPDGPGQKY
jgi:hypothetical protein